MNAGSNNFMQLAIVQMVSGNQLTDNLRTAAYWIAQAAKNAHLIVLPEYFAFMGNNDAERKAHAEDLGSGPIQDFLKQQAQLHGVYIVGGSVALRSEDPERFYNSCLVFNPKGECIYRYNKIHLFSFSRGGEQYDEALYSKAGAIDQALSFATEWGRVGVSICYDLRFPELFRAMGAVDVIVVPSAFTYTTGQAHWQVLLQARAIENQCYVAAPAQGGRHQNGRRTWGHSLLIDPWGQQLACLDTGAGCVQTPIDTTRIAKVRSNLPALTHRHSNWIF